MGGGVGRGDSVQDPQLLRGPWADLLASGRLCAHNWLGNGMSLLIFMVASGELLKLKRSGGLARGQYGGRGVFSQLVSKWSELGFVRAFGSGRS